MASGLLRDANAKRERKKLSRAADADRDPAVPDLPKTPSWEATPDSENGTESASETASGKDGDSAGENDSEKAGESAGGKGGGAEDGSPELPAARSSARPARRRGRPRGPERVPLSVRIRTDLDDQLSEAVERTSLSPQYIVEAALERHFRALGIKRS